jgi:signal transduction histidine kinase
VQAIEQIDAADVIRGSPTAPMLPWGAIRSLPPMSAPAASSPVASRLEQVLSHLVQNALDATDNGLGVVLNTRVDGAGVIEVIDSGCGMSADFVRNRLFTPFVSTKSGGFGIGAFEARELVKAMRGKLEVESREGLGSRFSVRLPLAPSEPGYLHFLQPDFSDPMKVARA